MRFLAINIFFITFEKYFMRGRFMEYRVNNLIYAAESEYHNRTGFHN